MWNKLTLRIKITITTALALSAVAIAITGLSIFNAGRIVIEPAFDFEQLIEDGYIEMFLLPADILEGRFEHFTINSLAEMQTEAQRNFRSISIIIVTIFVLLGTIASYLISGHVLKPINSLANKIEDIDANNLSTLIELPKSNDEVSSLTHSFNSMLGKLSRSFESQKLFAQNAAHELKTPLAALRASIEVLELEDKPAIDEYKEVVGIVKTGTENLIELVEGLLSISSVTDEMKWCDFSIKSAVRSIIDELRDDISEKNLTVDISGECRMRGDKTLFTRALFNLVHNAIRYNVQGGTVKIALAENSIIIEDGGVGIPSDSLRHIFEPFYCVDKSRSKKLGGHGLGLAITKNIVEKHNMEIAILSEVGAGTKIILSQSKS